MNRGNWRLLACVAMGLLVLASGCKVEVAQEKNKGKKKRAAAAKPKTTSSEPTSFHVNDDASSSKGRNTPRLYSKPERDFSSTPDTPSYSPPAYSPPARGMGASGVVQKVTGAIADTVELGPTLVIWALDVSESAFSTSMSMSSEIRGLYDKIGAKTSAAEGEAKGKSELLTALVTFSHEVAFPIEEPTSSKSDITTAFEKLKSDKTDKEVTFAAVKAAVEKYLPYRTQKQYQMVVVIVTDEAGDDGELADALIPTLDKYAIPVYAIGPSAPFGKAATMPSVSPGNFMAQKANNPTGHTHQGPESRYLEFVDIPSLSNNSNIGVTDSGFGPFHLEYLCRGSGGAYLSSGMSSTSEWGGRRGSTTVDHDVMQKYAPEYISEAEYQAQLSKNAAKKALHEAAKLPRVRTISEMHSDILSHATGKAQKNQQLATDLFNFYKKNEATFSNAVSAAQHIPAKLQPEIDKVYDVLVKGEKDRDKLTNPRWQASYDLAMGEILILKANVDGYNEMLAQIKRKSAFKNDSSSTWILSPADTLEVQSVLEKMLKKGRTYLERVVKDHPKTPWAKLAERDLAVQAGWKWDER